MHKPPHPGEFIRETYIEPFDISIRSLAENLGVAASTLARVVAKRPAVSPEMALRLSKALGRSPESWLATQDNYDLWQAGKSANLAKVRKIRFEATVWISRIWISQPNPSPRCRNRAIRAPLPLQGCLYAAAEKPRFYEAFCV
jgi:addiction module HigA family antidote